MASAAAAGAFSAPTPESAAPARETFPVREAAPLRETSVPAKPENPGVKSATTSYTPPAPVSAARETAPEAAKKFETGSVAAQGLSEEQVLEIRAAIQVQQKFLGELVEHGHRWELDGMELRIYFATEKRPFAEMIEGRESLEKVRVASSKVLGKSVRVCARIENVAGSIAPQAANTQELRAQFERDPMVKSMLQRFGGKISEVKRPVN